MSEKSEDMTSGKSAVRVGVDIGGTFTDVVLEKGDEQHAIKVLTTHAAPEEGILEGLASVCAKADVDTADITQIIHGTTLATNALIERRGAKTALVTTQGFRDVIEMRTESRFEQYDLDLVLPEPLLPRERRYTLEERVDADGEVLVPLDVVAVEALARTLARAGYDSIAVCFLHAYANPEHERLVAGMLDRLLPGASVSLSSEVSPRMREYERFNTTVANAYIKPMMKRYLERLRAVLATRGVTCPVFLIHSGGGIISLEDAAEYPVRLIESGPAGGAVYAADVARRHGLDRVLSFDMGGTTAKICLIRDGAPRTSRVFEVARSYRFKKGSGMPISIPVIDMVEIGAGGGSLAHVDSLAQIRVGPESAGSEPGPACYSRGGERPSVTDADLLLGRLDADNFAGGAFRLDAAAAATAVKQFISRPLEERPGRGLDGETAAFGLSEVVDENMANAARVHAVENGEDLAGYTMIAFGGAAPLHAARLCEKLGIERLLVPPGAGVGSAIGFLRAPFSFEAARSVFQRLSAFDSEASLLLLAELARDATRVVRACDPAAEVSVASKAYMRYAGQGWEVTVALSPAQAASPDASTLLALFEAQYAKLFGRVVEDLDVELTGWSVNATTPAEPVQRVPRHTEVLAELDRARHPVQPLFDPVRGAPQDALRVERSVMTQERQLSGPAVISEEATSVVIPADRTARLLPDGCLDVVRASDRVRPAAEASDVALQVIWNRLISIVEEQAQALVRTAFSPSVREAGDLSAGVYDAAGNMLAQAVTGTPGHVNAMADAVAHFMRRIGVDDMHEGDVYITNDPWEGTGHLHDITVVTPSFRDGRRVGFFGCTAHVVDIGGRGFGADADSVFEEGLYLPIMKFAERGTMDQTLLRLVRANVRQPDQLVGDMHALASCNTIGHRRLLDMMDEFSLENLEPVADFILEHSRRATLERIAALPNGRAESEMPIDGYARPVTLAVQVGIEDERVTCGFERSSGLDPKGINVPMVYTKAYACYALKCAIAPDIPNNAASLAPFEITAPENSIINALRPAPVALRHVIGHMIPDAVYGALDQLLPDTVPAEGAGTLCNFQLSLRPTSASSEARRAEVLAFNSGGSGARPRQDGLDATAFPSGVMTMPVEATEQTGPVVIWRKELRPDSGGVGRHRGGLGQFMEVGSSDAHDFDFSAMFDRVDHPARGRHGGGDGAPMRLELDDGTALGGKGKQSIASARRVLLAMPGGAGHGPVGERDAVAIRRDLARGYISESVARRDYGLSSKCIDAVRRAVEHGEDLPEDWS